MKKTNFVVVFWLVLALISFVTFLIQLSNFWFNISAFIIPYTEPGYSDTLQDLKRSLIANVPMLLISGGLFIFFMRSGLNLYRTLSNDGEMK